MKQAITGVAPSTISEVTVMTVWPSIAALPIGRMIGRLCMIGGRGPLAIGKLLFAPLMIPVAINVFLHMLTFGARRYRVTNRRVIEEKGIRAHPAKWVDLDQFDAIDVVVRPGQEWYPAGDLVFRRGNVETFRLEGVSRPEAFKQVCLKAQRGYVSVRKFATV